MFTAPFSAAAREDIVTLQLTEIPQQGFHRVVLARDVQARYTGVIAIHSITRGPALGGTRLRHYRSAADAVIDALLLAENMTMKSAFAALPFGGGKAAVLAPSGPFNREELLHAHGRAVEALGGEYVTAEDVGTTPADLKDIRATTTHVLELSEQSIDSAWATARGVLRAIEGAAEHVWGSAVLEARDVVMQGCGATGRALAAELLARKANIRASDVVATQAERCRQMGAQIVAPETALELRCDILAPCALGGGFDDASAETVDARIIAGSANNQLVHDGVAVRFAARGITFVPDFVSNSGGVIAACPELLGWTADRAIAKIDAIRSGVVELLAEADARRTTPQALALEKARAAAAA